MNAFEIQMSALCIEGMNARFKDQVCIPSNLVSFYTGPYHAVPLGKPLLLTDAGM